MLYKPHDGSGIALTTYSLNNGARRQKEHVKHPRRCRLEASMETLWQVIQSSFHPVGTRAIFIIILLQRTRWQELSIQTNHHFVAAITPTVVLPRELVAPQLITAQTQPIFDGLRFGTQDFQRCLVPGRLAWSQPLQARATQDAVSLSQPRWAFLNSYFSAGAGDGISRVSGR